MNTLSNPPGLPILAQEAVNETEDRVDVQAGRRLTSQEWAEAVPPFVHLNPQFDWTKTEYEIAQKWIGVRATGWWYYADRRFIFEKLDDAVMFKMWASENPTANNLGEV